jgi:hypothetical protein
MFDYPEAPGAGGAGGGSGSGRVGLASLLQPLSLHEGQPVAIEHKPDIDREKTRIGPAKQGTLFQQAHLRLPNIIAYRVKRRR